MKAIEGVYKQGALLTAGVAVVLFALGGCGGGGGGGGVVGGGAGGGGGGSPQGFSYPPSLGGATLAQIDGFSAAFSVTGNTLTSTAPSVLSGAVIVTPNTPTPGDYHFSVSGIQHGGNTEPTFTFTVNAATLAPNGSIAGACNGCLRTGSVPASDGQTVTITDANLAALGLNYSTMGLWSKPSDLAAAPNTQLGSAFVFGVETRGVDLPTTGQATYTGPMIGRYAGNPGTGAGVFTVGATANATANFTSRSVAFSTTNSMRTADVGGVITADPNLNLTGTLAYAAGVNNLTSTSLSTAGYNMSGQAKAMFFGPPAATAPFAPPELGGSVAVSSPGGSQSMVGTFVLKRP